VKSCVTVCYLCVYGAETEEAFEANLAQAAFGPEPLTSPEPVIAYEVQDLDLDWCLRVE